MESHDEERITFKNIKYGNSSGAYSVKDFATALRRMELNAAFMLTIPGPKLIYEFGELGYDFSRCHLATNGEGGDCNTKLDPKPIRWDYQTVIQRKRVYDIYSSLNKLRFHPWYKDVFIANNINLNRSLGSAFKSITVRSATDSSMMCVVGNFDVTAQSSTFTFPSAGTWYDYLNGGTITTTGSAQTINLEPGEYHVYLNRNLVNAVTTPVTSVNNPGQSFSAVVYPNPAQPSSLLEINVPVSGKVQVDLLTVSGQQLATVYSGALARGKQQVPLADKINNLPAGIYILSIHAKNEKQLIKLAVQ